MLRLPIKMCVHVLLDNDTINSEHRAGNKNAQPNEACLFSPFLKFEFTLRG